MDNFTIFDMLYEDFKFTKPIRLIECFAGYGSQAMSLQRLGLNFEHWKICEWATKSIQAYKDVHFTNDNTDYSKDLTQEEVVEYLAKKGVSMNYNEPMSLEQIKRKGEIWQRTTYNNIIATHNLVNISQVKGKDLEIVETNKYEYILTYSFPCQDLSLAGKRAGMEKDSGTRSGLLWEVERILDECKELGTLPKILLMENVPEVVGANNIEHFKKWRLKLEQLGYSNYDKILNAKDFGIPQNRRRCFMVSILGEYNYSFPQEFPLKLKLKDMLEERVDEKYYLSNKMIQGMTNTKFESYKLENKLLEPNGVARTVIARFEGTPQCIEVKEATKKGYAIAFEGDGVDISARAKYHRGNVQKQSSQTITTAGGNNVGVVVVGNYSPSNHNTARIVDSKGVAPTVMENHGTVTAAVEEENLKAKLCNDLIRNGKVKENDVIRHSYSSSRMKGEMKDIQQNNISPTLDTRCDCLGVVVIDDSLVTKKYKEFIEENGFIPEMFNPYNKTEVKDIAPTQTAHCHNTGGSSAVLICDLFTDVEENQVINPLKDKTPYGWHFEQQVYDKEGITRTVKAGGGSGNIPKVIIDKHVVKQNLRIRKLTPRECGRLMGVSDDDITKMAQNQSDASLYHLFGDSIVVDVLYHIFKQMM